MKEKLLEIQKNLQTQDNRMTEEPMFIVQEAVQDWGIDDGYADGYTWTYDSMGEHHDIEEYPIEGITIKTLDEYCDQNHEDDEMYYEGKQFTKRYYRDRWEFVTACFTQHGCQCYIDSNKHNHQGKLRIYGWHTHRNQEFRDVRNFLMNEKF